MHVSINHYGIRDNYVQRRDWVVDTMMPTAVSERIAQQVATRVRFFVFPFRSPSDRSFLVIGVA